MEIKLISKVSDTIKVFMTPMGVQVWVKNLPTRKPHKDCGVCGEKIGEEPFYAPAAGPVLLNPKDRIHERCADAIQLLAMQTNPLIKEDEVTEL